LSIEPEVTYPRRGSRGNVSPRKGISNSKKLKVLLEEMAELEAQKSHLQRTMTEMEAKKAQYRALLQRLGFPVPNDHK
jgi:predicted RNase H-like nuclease (RuvC/YqgF family)